MYSDWTCLWLFKTIIFMWDKVIVSLDKANASTEEQVVNYAQLAKQVS